MDGGTPLPVPGKGGGTGRKGVPRVCSRRPSLEGRVLRAQTSSLGEKFRAALRPSLCPPCNPQEILPPRPASARLSPHPASAQAKQRELPPPAGSPPTQPAAPQHTHTHSGGPPPPPLACRAARHSSQELTPTFCPGAGRPGSWRGRVPGVKQAAFVQPVPGRGLRCRPGQRTRAACPGSAPWAGGGGRGQQLRPLPPAGLCPLRASPPSALSPPPAPPPGKLSSGASWDGGGGGCPGRAGPAGTVPRQGPHWGCPGTHTIPAPSPLSRGWEGFHLSLERGGGHRWRASLSFSLTLPRPAPRASPHPCSPQDSGGSGMGGAGGGGWEVGEAKAWAQQPSPGGWGSPGPPGHCPGLTLAGTRRAPWHPTSGRAGPVSFRVHHS